MTTLYEITAEYSSIMEALLDNGGELTPELERAFDNLHETETGKAEAYAAMVRNWQAEIPGVKAEIARLRDMVKVRENAVARLKERMQEHLVATGRKELGAGLLGKWRLVKNSRPTIYPRVTLEELPPCFVRVRPPEFNGQAAYEAWRRGDLPLELIRAEVGEHVRLS